MKKHAEKFGIEFAREAVKSIANHESAVKTVITRKNTYAARTILFATGANPRKLGIPGEDQFYGAGVSYCATCDGAFFAGKTVAVIGGGNTAFEDALYLARFAKKVYLIHRRGEYRAAKSLVMRAEQEAKIELLPNRTVQELVGENMLTHINLLHVPDEKQESLPCDGVFVAIGRNPNTGLAGAYVALTNDGFIQTDASMQTSVPGIFAAGDVRDTVLRQIVTAAADGAIAATQAGIYINS